MRAWCTATLPDWIKILSSREIWLAPLTGSLAHFAYDGSALLLAFCSRSIYARSGAKFRRRGAKLTLNLSLDSAFKRFEI